MTATLDVLLDEACDPLYEAVMECTEEAIVNALCMADEMRGQSGHVAPALPLDRLSEILQKYRQAFHQNGDPQRVPTPPRDEVPRAKPAGPSRD
jgi:D-aminopeptidase